MNIKEHWENIYSTKSPNEVSWTQDNPQTSIDLIENCRLPTSSKIIDIGGGESKQVDKLLDLGYNNLSVLDISQTALEKTQKRLGDKSYKVKWIVTDITEFQTSEKYDIWHDRAVFHFLTKSEDIDKYVNLVINNIRSGGFLILGTFSTNGPLKCSGLEITQYDENKMKALFDSNFDLIECFNINHQTPFDSIQNFIFCRFQRK